MKHRLPHLHPIQIFPRREASWPIPQTNRRSIARWQPSSTRSSKAAGLPICRSSFAIKFLLVVNLKTANALGLTLPPTLLTRADQVIE